MDFKNIQFDVDDGVGILTISRPKVLNALNDSTINEIRDVLAKTKEDETIRALIITGAGSKAFVAGADIGEVNNLNLKNGFDFFRKGDQMNRDIETLGIPTIAAVNGLALGGGCELAMSCTLRIVSERAKFGLPELSLGVIPGYGGTQRLPRLIGKGRALWYTLTGDMIESETAVELGLANIVVKPEELMEKAVKTAKKIMTKAPLAVKMAIFAINYGLETDLETGLILETALESIAVVSEDKKEGIEAFFNKRKPAFKGK